MKQEIEWWSVEDRLPDLLKDVLTKRSDGKFEVNYRADGTTYVDPNGFQMYREGVKVDYWAYFPEGKMPKAGIAPNGYIDWEQRRYEIAKQMMQAAYLSDSFARYYQDYERSSKQFLAKAAVTYADALIEELKKPKQ